MKPTGESGYGKLAAQWRDFLFDIQTRPSVRRGLALLIVLVFFNLFVAALALLLGHSYPILLGLTLLSWGLGLRHAMDADHIAAIDNVTRRLLYRGRPSVGVGFFFSLGHSTIVLLLTIAVAFFASIAKEHIESLRSIGVFIGSSISSVFLLSIGCANLFVLKKLFNAWNDLREGRKNNYHGHLHIGGPIEKLFRPLISMVDTSYKMYFIGFLFGLGFDTATEIGLLSVSALASLSLPPWSILILPLEFMAGMMLLDTMNSLLMLGIYTSTVLDVKQRLLYNINVTALSAFSALVIGSVIGLRLLAEGFGWEAGPLRSIARLNINSLGYVLVGLFILSALMMLLYRPKEEPVPG